MFKRKTKVDPQTAQIQGILERVRTRAASGWQDMHIDVLRRDFGAGAQIELVVASVCMSLEEIGYKGVEVEYYSPEKAGFVVVERPRRS